MRVLVCGGRYYSPAKTRGWLARHAREAIAEATGQQSTRIEALIHGGASGADMGAAQWGDDERLRVLCYPADWERDGKAAGPIRNRRMLTEGRPDVVIAFPGGRGTENMVSLAKSAGVRVIEVNPTAKEARR